MYSITPDFSNNTKPQHVHVQRKIQLNNNNKQANTYIDYVKLNNRLSVFISDRQSRIPTFTTKANKQTNNNNI